MSDFAAVRTPSLSGPPERVWVEFGRWMLRINASTALATGQSLAAWTGRGGAAVAGTSTATAGAVAGATGAVASAVGPLLSAVLGLWAIGQATLRGQQLGTYNAFITAFADSVYQYAAGRPPRWTNAAYPDGVRLGRGAAVSFLNAIPDADRNRIFEKYSRMGGSLARSTIQNALGGLRTR